MVSVESGSVGWLVGWGVSPDGARGWLAGHKRVGGWAQAGQAAASSEKN